MPTWQWVQLNAEFVRHSGQALPGARALFGRLGPLISRWRTDGHLRWFFFMRKPPDVRLRFLTNAEQDTMRELARQVIALHREGIVRSAFFSRYRPETQRFGGIRAMRFVHQYFDADSSLWMELDCAYQNGDHALCPKVIVSAVSHDLFGLAFGKDGAVRAWEELRALRPLPSEATVPECTVPSIDGLCRSMSHCAGSLQLLRRYTDANAQLAADLAKLTISRERLLRVLAWVAVFTFHRHGFDGARSACLIEGVLRSLSTFPASDGTQACVREAAKPL